MPGATKGHGETWCRAIESTTRVLPNQTTLVLTTRPKNPVDSLAQSCGLSLPIFHRKDWYMTSSIHVASSPACTASTGPFAPFLKQVDFVTGYCGLSPPTLFERIGIMAAEKPNSWRPESSATHQGCARVPVRPTATLIASGPVHTGRQPDTDGDAKGVTRPVGPGQDVTNCHRVRTTSPEARHAHTRRSVRPIGTVQRRRRPG
jgi:hypothetical protein